jgi:hypothetical protein
VPWSLFWERNLFVDAFPALRTVLQNNFLRGAVSGLGVINVGAAFVELASLMMNRQQGGRSAEAEA